MTAHRVMTADWGEFTAGLLGRSGADGDRVTLAGSSKKGVTPWKTKFFKIMIFRNNFKMK